MTNARIKQAADDAVLAELKAEVEAEYAALHACYIALIREDHAAFRAIEGSFTTLTNAFYGAYDNDPLDRLVVRETILRSMANVLRIRVRVIKLALVE